jgi:hypothetical protein
MALTSSMSPITGTGLKKCIPSTLSGREVAAPRSAIGIDDVLLARITSGLVTSSSRRNIPTFVS